MTDWTENELRQLARGWDPRAKCTAGPSRGDEARLELARRGEL